MAYEDRPSWLPESATRDNLIKASQAADASLTWARLLIKEGFPGPALVWAVRSVEIFMKEFVLTSLFISEDEEHDWDRAVRKASNLFERLSWKKAIERMEAQFGPLDPMLTQDGRDALVVWEKEIVPARHNIVHGREEPTAEFAIQVVLWAQQMLMQLKLRLIVGGKHPFSKVFKQILEAAKDAYHGRSASEVASEEGRSTN